MRTLLSSSGGGGGRIRLSTVRFTISGSNIIFFEGAFFLIQKCIHFSFKNILVFLHAPIVWPRFKRLERCWTVLVFPPGGAGCTARRRSSRSGGGCLSLLLITRRSSRSRGGSLLP